MSVGLTFCIGLGGTQQTPTEVETNSGLQSASTTDARHFVAGIDFVVIARLENVGVQFLSGDSAVFTRMRFSVLEYVKNPTVSASEAALVVWELGGSYLQSPAGRVPHKPARIARQLKVGATYFVPITHIDAPPVNGLWLLAADDALAEIAASSVAAAGASQDWVRAIVAQGQAHFDAPGQSRNDREAFLWVLRRASGLGR